MAEFKILLGVELREREHEPLKNEGDNLRVPDIWKVSLTQTE
jgi:hypothetical protein